jgi:MOSC domain-containing protein YiiM
MTATIKHLSVGLPQKENFNGKELITGICKKPIAGPQTLSGQGFHGDGVGDRKHHGGSDKAVCVYCINHYAYWESVLGITMPEAAFGENLSVTDLREEDVCIGDRYTIGTAEVQVSQPRQPCATLAAKYGREDFIKLVADSGRTGFYFRVLKEGRVQAGDAVVLVEQDPRKVSVTFANNIYYRDRKNREGIEKVLSVPALSDSWRKTFQELLASA